MNPPESKRLTRSKYLKPKGRFGALSEVSQLEVLKCALERGASMRMTVYGESMMPFLRNGDVVTISPLEGRPPQIGDILAFEKPGARKLVIHRLVRKCEYGYELKGDNCRRPDETASEFHLQGVVAQIERNNRKKTLGTGKSKRWIAVLSKINLFYWFHRFIQISIKSVKVVLQMIPPRNFRFAQNERLEEPDGKKD